MPPAPTGIAAYDAAIHGGLRRIGFDVPIDVMWPVGPRQVAELASYPLGVFQLGNNAEFHLAIYRAAWRAGGLVVLHDLALDDFVGALSASGDPLGPVAVREALEAMPGVADLDVDEPLRVPWCAAIARRARGIVVHSSFARAYLEAAGCRTPIFVVPHPPPEDPSDLAAAAPRAAALRASVASRGGSRLVVAPGDVNAAKQLESVLEAVAGLDGSVHLAIVGRRIPGYDVEPAVRATGLGERVDVRLDVSDEDFRAWLLAADVTVDLRHPHRGEVSGSLARSMQAGRPAIVSATGSYLDEPDDAIVRIAAGPADADELAAAIRGLLDDDGGLRGAERLGGRRPRVRGGDPSDAVARDRPRVPGPRRLGEEPGRDRGRRAARACGRRARVRPRARQLHAIAMSPPAGPLRAPCYTRPR
jgi:glycosyltransferase involved in cell wall biosynthesis